MCSSTNHHACATWWGEIELLRTDFPVWIMVIINIPRTTEAGRIRYSCLVNKKLLEGPAIKQNFFDETEVVGFWVPANCDVLAESFTTFFRTHSSEVSSRVTPLHPSTRKVPDWTCVQTADGVWMKNKRENTRMAADPARIPPNSYIKRFFGWRRQKLLQRQNRI